LSRLVDDFNRQRSNGRIFAQAVPLATLGGELRAQALAGAGPHIALLPSHWLGSLAREGVLLPLDEVISPVEQRALLPVTISAAQARDREGQQRLYGLPISFDTMALFYNKANIQFPPDDATVLFDLARGLSDPNARPPVWGLAANLSIDTTIGYLYAFGGRLFEDDGTPALAGSGREGAEQWLAWVARLNADPELFVRPDIGIQVDKELKNGNALMTFGWAHQVADYRHLWKDQLGIAPLPRLRETNQPPQPYLQGQVLVINRLAGEGERQAAVEFLRYMIGDAAQRSLLEGDLQPARQDLSLDADTPQTVAARAFRAQAEHAQPMPNGPERERIRQELRRMQQRVLTNQAAPRDAVAEADSQLRAILKLPPR
jgi:maltose-binding protein MalE